MNPNKEHRDVVKCILKYLRKAKYMVFVYGDGELKVDSYTNSDFQPDVMIENLPWIYFHQW